jgi:YD repeat-containing protein
MKASSSNRTITLSRALILLLCATLPLLAPASTSTYTYDALGRLKTITSTNGSSITYSYDAAGNRTSVVTVAGAPGAVQFSSSTYSGGEASGQQTITITVNRIGGSTGGASIHYATANGTATAGSDYSSTSGDLTWPDGDTTNRTFNVTVLDDAAVEGAETFTVALSSPVGATLGSPVSATVTINDNDNPPAGTMQLSASSYSIAENGGSLTVTATRTGGSFGALSASYATNNGSAVSGSDYTTTTGTLNWANGDAANKTFSVPIINDTAVESTETFSVGLTAVTGTLGSPGSATVTVTDEDMPTITIADRGVQTQGASGETAFYRLTSGGDIIVSNGTAGGPDLDVGDWLTPKTQMNRFEARATLVLNQGCNASVFGTWLNLGSNVTWQAVMSNSSALAIGHCNFTLEIRDSVTLSVLGTASIQLTPVDTPP